MGEKPIGLNPGMDQIKPFLISQNKCNLWSISNWDVNNHNSWIEWKISCPPHLENEKLTLLHHLQGKTPISKRSKDSRGWGSKSGSYDMAAGYLILSRPLPIPGQEIWKSIWSSKTLPKIDFFILDLGSQQNFNR